LSDSDSFNSLLFLANPVVNPRKKRADEELIALGRLEEDKIIVPLQTREIPTDVLFTEGKRVRVTHLRTERSPQLRKMYFEHLPPPFLCDMCRIDLAVKYPWTDNLLELHHLLPLRSTVNISTKGTSLDDVIPVCPSCHKSIHAFYRIFLKYNSISDFETKKQAHDIYDNAKELIVL